MANLIKWILFAYLDVLTSIAQLLVTVISVPVSTYYHFKNNKRDGQGNSWQQIELVPTFNLAFAIIAAYVTIGNILKGTKLLKEENNNANDEVLETSRVNWTYWYRAMNLVTLVWFLFFVFTIFDQVDFPLVYVGLVAIIFVRAMLACMFCVLLAEDEINRQAASMSNVEMEPAIELFEIRD